MKIGFERLGEQLGRNMWMIREWDHQLCEQQLSSLIPVLDQMRLDLDNTQAEISTVTLPHNNVGAARKSETSPVATDRILTKCQRHPIIQPVPDSLLGGTPKQRQTFYMLSDKAHTCQKEL